jgi:integrative and conjugative element protein (TIGR02256 family)
MSFLLRFNRIAKTTKPTVGKAWIPDEVSKLLVKEATSAFPNETGGVLMGYWGVAYSEVVVTHAVGPGPLALHYRKSFLPDATYQENEIARIYEDSNRISTYLGDWHTHPKGSSFLSYRDKRTLRRIADHSDARCSIPIMAVLGGGDNDWFMRVWKYQRQTRSREIFGIRVESMVLKQYLQAE